MQLYANPSSSPCRMIVSLCEQYKIPYEYKKLDLIKMEQKEAEILKLNPNGKVPIIVDGDFVLFEAWAIARYLLDKYAPDNTIYPKDVKQRAIVDMYIG